ncbi:MAG: hypothetical protein KBG48_20015 [Kofleriaceae bacterium]|jgi:hypothetical protein|nr:hypothetical protein [Kofleriaceae bacterium]MBP9169699.1 hypothetical protein [Kofleriaceae bacterium]MBP9859931.1 hypothetical protein [Kofleriaceae bacterium]
MVRLAFVSLLAVLTACPSPPPAGPLARAASSPSATPVDAPPTTAVVDAGPAADPVTTTVTIAVDAGPTSAPPRAAACAPTYAQVPVGQLCAPPRGGAKPVRDAPTTSAEGTQCSYPEGSCYCGAEPVCSGVLMTQEDSARLRVIWQCTPVPPMVRPDGCPGREPNGPCARDGQQCSYGSCCVSHYTCRGGQWSWTGGGCPP